SILLQSLFVASRAPLPLSSFPTRRSSDLAGVLVLDELGGPHLVLAHARDVDGVRPGDLADAADDLLRSGQAVLGLGPAQRVVLRSEEHTSELQSRFDLVCRLLLEKKKHNY